LSPSLQARPYPACAALAPIGMTQAVALRTTAGSVPGKATGVLAPHSREKAAARPPSSALGAPSRTWAPRFASQHPMAKSGLAGRTGTRSRDCAGDQSPRRSRLGRSARPLGHPKARRRPFARLARTSCSPHRGAIALSLAPARAQAHQRTRAVLSPGVEDSTRSKCCVLGLALRAPFPEAAGTRHLQ